MIFATKEGSTVAGLCRAQALAWLFEASARMVNGEDSRQLIQQALSAWADAGQLEQRKVFQ